MEIREGPQSGMDVGQTAKISFPSEQAPMGPSASTEIVGIRDELDQAFAAFELLGHRAERFMGPPQIDERADTPPAVGPCSDEVGDLFAIRQRVRDLAYAIAAAAHRLEP